MKRTDFSARTVIGADPTLKVNQLVIPIEVAKIHTKPEIVTKVNKEWLTHLVNNDKANFLTTTKMIKDEYGNEIPDPTGTKIRINLQYALYKKGTELLYGDIIVRKGEEIEEDKDGNVILGGKLEKKVFEKVFEDEKDEKDDRFVIEEEWVDEDEDNKGDKGDKGDKYRNNNYVPVVTGFEKIFPDDKLIRDGKIIPIVLSTKKKIELKIGDVVERHLQKGDVVILNRQPTLHKGSMFGMEVIPMPYKTFRFNLGITRSLNADFDLNADL